MFSIANNPSTSLTDENKWSNSFIEFVKKCLTSDPIMRPTASELLRSKFIKEKIKDRK